MNEWDNLNNEPRSLEILNKVVTGPSYSIWWQLSDWNNQLVRHCELMIKLSCKASKLKDDDGRLKRSPFGAKMCTRCELSLLENTTHMVMQCPANEVHRTNLNREVMAICPDIDPQEFFNILMGKYIDDWDFEDMKPIWESSARHVTKMYGDTLRDREGMG